MKFIANRVDVALKILQFHVDKDLQVAAHTQQVDSDAAKVGASRRLNVLCIDLSRGLVRGQEQGRMQLQSAFLGNGRQKSWGRGGASLLAQFTLDPILYGFNDLPVYVGH